MLTIVVVGASAGGLEALRSFFRAATPAPDVAVVVITHLPATGDSHLVPLLANVGTLPVRAAVDGQPIEGGNAYVLPPGTLVGVHDGQFAVRPPPPQRLPAKPIDFFMTALADDAPERCVGVVLSGTDHDGTAGLRAIRAAGGLALVQSPETAEFTGMPHSAIDAGVADQVLPPAAMPGAIRQFLDHVAADLGALASDESKAADETLEDVLRTLLARTGHDFRCYRPGMLRRRLRRRMGLNGVDRIRDYLELLKASDAEADVLKREFLIGVTDFFRDPEAWRELDDEVLPAMLDARCDADQPVRVWTPGCATGEESYSIAMLMLEHVARRGGTRPVQVFATDIDLDALAVARAGAYPPSSVASIPAERIARFFDRQGDRYVARKSLRDTILVAPHDLARDTPYSRLDLVLCRNLLIYFQPHLQQRVFESFHFALKPGGLLLLGKAESVGTQPGLFEPVSRKIRLYRRIGGRAHLPAGLTRSAQAAGSVFPPEAAPGRPVPTHTLLERALAGRTPRAAVLVDSGGRALHFHGDADAFLRHQGSASLELATLVLPALRVRLRRALRQALDEQHGSVQSALLESRGAARRVRVEVEPVSASDSRRLALVTFDVAADPGDAAEATDGTAATAGEAMGGDYEEARRELAIALEEAERSNEDLRVANEESLSLNEELQSSNEELESSKEELESLNEELSTLNAQLEEKIHELARTNEDLGGLLASSQVATVLLDRELRVRRFTPSATQIFNLKSGDEGRLLSDISSRVSDPRFAQDLARMDAVDGAFDAEIEGADGKVYLRRLLPHRDPHGALLGVVATFLDVTPLRTVSRRLAELVAVLQDSNDAVIVYDLEGRILEWNAGATKAYGFRRDEVVGTSILELVPPEARAEAQGRMASMREQGHAGPEDVQRRHRDGRTLAVSVTVSALQASGGRPFALLSTERDITERLKTEKEMYFHRLADLIPALLRVEDCDGLTEFVNRGCAEFTGREPATLLGEGWLDAMSPEDRPAFRAALASALESRSRYEVDYRYRRADGAYRWMRSIGVPRLHDSGAFAGFVTLALDVEDRKRAEDALRDADHRKDEYLAMLAHELRNPLAPIRNATAVLAGLVGQAPETTWAAGVIARQTEVLAKLLDDLLDVARIARGKVTLDLGRVDLAVVAERAIEVATPAIEARRQHLEVQLPPVPLVVEGDLVRLVQVLTNLLNNAVKYTQPGGHLRIELERGGDAAIMRVSDDGAGIAADMLPRVFDLFAQADRTLDRAKGGLGLGLTLVRRLVELHHGTVEATSAGLGHGSQFVVRLPLTEIPAPQGRSSAAPSAPRPGRSRRVLVVDDNADAVDSLAMVLRHRDHEVHTAYDGRAALSAAQSVLPDVVVLDIGLPDVDGYQVARALRSQRATARATLIALTGYGQSEDAARGRAAGFDFHLVKPADPDQIAALIESSPVRTTG
ncbi:MAG: CheR family methyltransferase [Pseudomonadota bacterium]